MTNRLTSVAGGYGPVPAAPIDTTREVPAAARLSPRDAERLMQAELIAAVRSLTESSTEIASRIGRRGATNGVLDVFLDTIGASTYITRDYPVTVGSLVVTNHGATAITVMSGPPGPAAPASGRGVQRIETLARLIVPIADRTFTIWGAAAVTVSVQAFTGLQPYGTGVLP